MKHLTYNQLTIIHKIYKLINYYVFVKLTNINAVKYLIKTKHPNPKGLNI